MISVSGLDVSGRRPVAEEIPTGRPTAALRVTAGGGGGHLAED